MLTITSISFIISLATCLFLIKYVRLDDSIHAGPQRFHTGSIPRVGGLALYAGLVGACIKMLVCDAGCAREYIKLLAIPFIPFFSGLVEDIRKSMGVTIRLLAIVIGTSMAFFVLNARVVRLDLPTDFLFDHWLVSFVFTTFALTGMTNAMNIIDGFNGLASMVAITILTGLGYVAFKVGDVCMMIYCIVMIGALLGFFILNYPNGLIFLGDCGAYLTGLYIGIISVLLVYKHREVSPWFAFLINGYPVVETMFSIYRRTFLKKSQPGLPDALHLHSIVYKILSKRLLGRGAKKLKRNAITSPFLWMLNSISVMPAILFWDDSHILITFSILFVFIYVYFYRRLLVSKIPLWARNVR